MWRSNLGRPMGQVGDGALSDLAAVAIALPQQDGGRRVPVGHGFDIHGANMSYLMTSRNINILIYMATYFWPNSRKLTAFNRLQIFQEGSSG